MSDWRGRSKSGWLTVPVAIVLLLASAWSLASGFRVVASGVRALPAARLTSTTSSDALLAAETPSLTSDDVRRAIAAVPEEEAVAFVGVEGSSGYFSRLYVFSLLALPRQMPGITCQPRGGLADVPVPLDPGLKVGAVIFDRVAPGDAAARTLAPGVWWTTLASPVESAPRWTSFCPSSPPPPF
jgi:hypothetical protein